MSNIVQFRDIDRIEEEACDWISLLDSGALTRETTERLHQWLNEDESHAATLIEVADLLDKMTVLSELETIFPLESVGRKHPKTKRNWIDRFHMGPVSAAMGACMVLLAIFVVARLAVLPENAPQNMYSTSIGEIRTVRLDDGSSVTLNTNSKISIEFADQERHVVLHQGEALFEVADDRLRPFVVEANGSIIKAIGTAFNVEINNKDIEVTVTEGVVEIASLPVKALLRLADSDVESRKPQKPERLIAGESAIIQKAIIEVISIKGDEIENRLAWKQRQLVFHGETLEEVVAEVSRYTDQSIIIVDDSIRAIQIGGRFEADNIDNLLDILEHGFNIRSFKTNDGRIILASTDGSRNRS